MASDDPQANIRIGADDEPLRRSLRELLGRVSAFGDASKTHLQGVGDSALNLRSKLLSVSAVLSGGAIATYLKHTIDLQDELSKAAQKAGTTTEQFSSMTYAAKLADVGTEELSRAYSKLNTLLTEGQSGKKEAVALLKSIGVDPQKVKDSDQLLLILAERFEGMADGAHKSALASAVFGERLGPGLIPFLNQGRGGIEELRKEAEKLGVVISTEQGKQAEEFNDNLTRLGTAARGAANQIMAGLLPSLTEASAFFVKATKDAGLFEGTLISIGALMAKVLGKDEQGQLEATLKDLEDRAHRLGVVKQNLENLVAMRPDNQGAQQQLADIRRQIEAINAQAQQARQSLISLHAGSSTAGAGRGSVNPASAFPAGPAGDWKSPTGPAQALPNPAQSYMQYYELMLAEEKRASSILDAGREYTKEQELAFWQTLGQAAQLTANDRLAVSRKVYQLETAIERQSAQDRVKIAADAAQASTQFAFGKVDAQRQAAQSAYDVGAISGLQLLALEVQFEQQRYDIQRAALEQRLELLALDPTLNAVEMARMKAEVLLIEQQHEARRAELLQQSRNEQLSRSAGPAAVLGDASTWDGYFNRLLTATQGWRAAMTGIFSSIGQAFLQQIVIRPAAEYAAGLARMLLVKLGFLSSEKAAQAGAAAATVSIKASETAAVIPMDAAQGGAEAGKAMAGIPFVGPVLALAAMATIFAAISALGSRKSAAGGYDIPSGVNPVTQLHEEEMVLPSPLANAVRRMADGGDGADGGGGGGSFALHATPLPGGFWMAHETSFVRFFETLQRNKRVR